MAVRERTRAERVIWWIENFCHVPHGVGIGDQVRLRDWQKEVIKQIYDNPAGTRRAVITFGRKNGKTAMASWLCLAHLCGPEAVRNSRIFSTATASQQASILYDMIYDTAMFDQNLRSWLRFTRNRRLAFCEKLGTRYEGLSRKSVSVEGTSPAFCIHDELGSVEKDFDEVYAQIETGTAANPKAMSIIISTQAAAPEHLLSRIIDRMRENRNPKEVLIEHIAPDGDDHDPFALETIAVANPALGDFQTEEQVLEQAAEARELPSMEPQYRRRVLNQRAGASAPLISPRVWERCQVKTEELADLYGDLPVYGGLDLSQRTDLTAAVFCVVRGDEYHIHPFFWLPRDGLKERSRAIPYDRWAEDGLIETVPGPVIEYKWLAQRFYGLVKNSGMNLRAFAYDRAMFRNFREWMYQVGWKKAEVEGVNEATGKKLATPGLFKEFGQGWVDMHPAICMLEELLLKSNLKHDGNGVLTMCVRNVQITQDAANNKKMNKAKSSGQIDGAVAMAMAVATAAEKHHRQRGSGLWGEGKETITEALKRRRAQK